MTRPALVWFRNDLRLADNPALSEALAGGGPVIPVYILDDEAAGAWRSGSAARWWLHGSLASLQRDLAGLGLHLRLLVGDSADCIDRLVAESGAETVLWNRRYEPWAIAQDKLIKAGLERRGIRARSHNGSLGREPWEVLRVGGEPYKVFTPFWRAWTAHGALPDPLPAPAPVGEPVEPHGAALEALALLPTTPDWAAGLRATWTPGEAAAWAELHELRRRPRRRLQVRPQFPSRAGRVAPVAAAAPWRAVAAPGLASRPVGGGGRSVPAPAGLARVRLPPAVPLPPTA